MIATQHNQQETLVHIISLRNITTYATQVNRQHVNILMDTMEKKHQDSMTLYILSMQQLKLSANYTPHPIYLAKPPGFLSHYMREVAIHTMDVVDAATIGILSPHVLPVTNLREVL